MDTRSISVLKFVVEQTLSPGNGLHTYTLDDLAKWEVQVDLLAMIGRSHHGGNGPTSGSLRQSKCSQNGASIVLNSMLKTMGNVKRKGIGELLFGEEIDNSRTIGALRTLARSSLLPTSYLLSGISQIIRGVPLSCCLLWCHIGSLNGPVSYVDCVT
uniref:Uncharacterized protein n=1 Tax=Oryza sativa subsp. japonica TaxID=39947 RepID=Q8S620_ORYSJ|nr:hypothetical protein [Oryza sativa Japonica Group]